MGFKTSTQLKTAYMSALIANGNVPAFKEGRGAGKADKAKEVGVGKRGSIIISKKLVESFMICQEQIHRPENKGGNLVEDRKIGIDYFGQNQIATVNFGLLPLGSLYSLLGQK